MKAEVTYQYNTDYNLKSILRGKLRCSQGQTIMLSGVNYNALRGKLR